MRFFRRRKPPAPYGNRMPGEAETAQVGIWGMWLETERLESEGRMEEAKALMAKANAIEEEFLWGIP